MIIGIDGNEANIKNRVGVNQLAFELLGNFYDIHKNKRTHHNFVIYLKEEPLSDLPKPDTGWVYKILPGKKFWIIRTLMPHLFKTDEKPDILFTPSHYVVPFSIVPKICVITDLGYLNFSGHFKKTDFWQLKYWTAWSIIVSKKIIAISQSTKKDIVRHYPWSLKKISVVPLAYDVNKFNSKISVNDVRRIKEKYSISGDYILFISTLKPSKNVEGLIRAFKEVSKEFPDLKLVIAGKKGWFYESIYKVAEETHLSQKIIFTDFIPEEDKPPLIAGAKIFVLVSFWEGFGLDPLYAMATGIPVVVSNAGSLPEVVGDAGVIVDPYNIYDIAKGINRVVSASSIEYNRLVREGLKQANKFSWQRTSEEVLKIIENAK